MPEPAARLDADMKAVIQAAHLCFAAAVTPDGRPVRRGDAPRLR
jgi:hypothetical protein